ncbi:MAG: hypothetical protein RLZZ385_1786 [Pseudomonadota bacterium]|jgi:16S rRNA (cytosine1402-N4)-methyltransferase
MMTDVVHQTVLREQAVDALLVNDDGIYLDGTFGRGGHSRLILERLGPEGRLIALDRDPEAVNCGQALASEDSRFTMVPGSFGNLDAIGPLQEFRGRLSGLLLDLGVSSPQLDQPHRGFSFQQDGPLDMRMNPSAGISAAEWISSASEAEIADVLFHLGEERFARRMARAIVQARQTEPIRTTARLADIVKQANPAWERGKHPATRAFQAIRIHINQELDELHGVLQQSLDWLRVGGRLVVISFHSLEDRIVKKFIAMQTKGDNFPRGLPVPQSHLQPRLKTIGKPVKTGAEETADNPRARSAIMRVAEKLGEPLSA